MSKAVVIIPSRFQSSRFAGKPLAPILGKPMIQWVYEGVRQARLVDRILIATDDERIFEAARGFGAEVVMTEAKHRSGTDRVAEVAASVETSLVVNVQGDEPLVDGDMLDFLIQVLEEEPIDMASLMVRREDMEFFADPNLVKVVVDREGFALYFSRAPLPFGAKDFFYQHIGVYGYRRNFLLRYVQMRRSRLEESENLEQLRALENGCRIRMVEVDRPTLSVDTPADIIRVESLLAERRHA